MKKLKKFFGYFLFAVALSGCNKEETVPPAPEPGLPVLVKYDRAAQTAILQNYEPGDTMAGVIGFASESTIKLYHWYKFDDNNPSEPWKKTISYVFPQNDTGSICWMNRPAETKTKYVILLLGRQELDGYHPYFKVPADNDRFQSSTAVITPTMTKFTLTSKFSTNKMEISVEDIKRQGSIIFWYDHP